MNGNNPPSATTPATSEGTETDANTQPDSNAAREESTTNDQTSNPGRRPQPPAREASTIFANIREAIDTSNLESEFKQIMLYDLEQARLSYYNRAFKATVIMLGAVVEGLMLGTLRRPEFMDLMINDASPPRAVARLGTRNPAFADRSIFAAHIATELDFESFRTVLHHYIEATQHLGINDVQKFRNAVHPWRCVQNPAIYGEYGPARALAHLAALEPLARFLLAWTP